MKLFTKMDEFFNRPMLKVIIIVLSILGSGIAIKEYFFPNFIIIENSNYKPNVIFDQDPKFTAIGIQDSLTFEFRVPLYKINDAIPKSSPVFLQDSTEGWIPYFISDQQIDSMLRTISNLSISSVSISGELNLKFKNIGNAPAQITQVFFASELKSSLYLLRDLFYNPISNKKQKNIQRYEIRTFSYRTLLPDSTFEIVFPYIPLPLPFDSLDHTSIFHLLLLYKDTKNNYFDSYYWIKYKNFFPTYKIKRSIHFNWDSLANITYTSTPSFDPPFKTGDFIKLLESTYEYGHQLTDVEKTNVLSNISN